MKKSYHHGDLKQTLVGTLYELVNSEPLEHLTVRFLTDRLGVSRTAIYRHFPSKEALFSAVVQKAFDALEAALAEVAVEQDPLQRLHGLGGAYLDFALHYPRHYRLMMNDQWRVYREHGCSDCEDKRKGGAFEIVIDACRAAQAAGALREEDALTQATAFWAMVHGIASLTIDGHLPEEEMGALYESLFRMSCEGMCR
ncbi:MAG TPA: TetR/AcrR family transcriptional regulator [Thiolapillus brandeum]|uniref:TetR/AcrR family transcriptional regulator n=1 Tax=Thiolapillus brandeum TaxID=1076588 RepID=A0A831RTD6_9GAMM|nr:TetR/AcrR family transcriptional regulator [Thiolapillus brandeum]